MANYLRSHVSNKVSLAMFVMSILRCWMYAKENDTSKGFS
jgi:hypothetical protein